MQDERALFKYMNINQIKESFLTSVLNYKKDFLEFILDNKETKIGLMTFDNTGDIKYKKRFFISFNEKRTNVYCHCSLINSLGNEENFYLELFKKDKQNLFKNLVNEGPITFSDLEKKFLDEGEAQIYFSIKNQYKNGFETSGIKKRGNPTLVDKISLCKLYKKLQKNEIYAHRESGFNEVLYKQIEKNIFSLQDSNF